MPGFNGARHILGALVIGVLAGCAHGPDASQERPASSNLMSKPERTGGSLLVDAAARGDVAGIRSLIGNGVSVNAVDTRQRSALFAAAREGEFESARMLLGAGASVDGRGGPMTPLAAAALHSHVKLARLLIRNGADLESPGENDQTALMSAVKLNRIDVAQALLEAGANTRIKDRNGANLLVVSVTRDQPDMLSLLLRHTKHLDMVDKDGRTALHWAEHLKRPHLAQILRDASADLARTRVEIVRSKPNAFGGEQ